MTHNSATPIVDIDSGPKTRKLIKNPDEETAAKQYQIIGMSHASKYQTQTMDDADNSATPAIDIDSAPKNRKLIINLDEETAARKCPITGMSHARKYQTHTKDDADNRATHHSSQNSSQISTLTHLQYKTKP